MTTPAAELKTKWQNLYKGKYDYPLAFRREYLLVLADEPYVLYQLYLNEGHMIEYTINDNTGEIADIKVKRGIDLLGGIQASTSLCNLITAKQFWSNLL